MTDLDTNAAAKLSTRAAKSLDAMRAAITRADEARSDAAHQARAVNVVDAAQTAVTDHLAAADAWDALARHATAHARAGQRGADPPGGPSGYSASPRRARAVTAPAPSAPHPPVTRPALISPAWPRAGVPPS